MGRQGLALLASLVALCSCATSGEAPVAPKGKAPLPAFCAVQTAYRPPYREMQHVAKAPYTTDYLLKLNTYGKKVCGWKEISK